MAKSLDEIFGQTQKKRTLDEIFAPPTPEPAKAPQLSMQGLRELNDGISTRPVGWNHDPLPGENTNLSAPIANTLYTFSTPLRAFFNAPFNQRAGQTGAEIMTGVRQGKTSTGSKGLDVAADLVGGVMGFGANPGGNIGASAFKAGEKAIAPLLPKLPKVGQIAAPLAAGSVAYDVADKGLNGDPLSPKDMAIAAGSNAALGLLPFGIGKGIEATRTPRIKLPELKSNPLEDIQNAYKTPSLHDVRQKEYEQLFSGNQKPMTTQFSPLRAESPLQYFRTTQADVEAAFPPRKIGQYSFATGEQRALDNLQQGIREAQNYVKHNDVLAAYPPGTTIEQAYADIKANTGVDLLKLQADYQASVSRKTSLTPEELRLGKVAGVIPDLKQRETLTPKIELPKIEQQRIEPPKLEPRQWTNAEHIQARSGQFSPFELPKLDPKKIELPNPQKAEIKLPDLNRPGEEGWVSLRDGSTSNTPLAAKAVEPLEFKAPEPFLIPNPVKDIGNFKAYTSDPYRIFRDVLGKEEGTEFLKPFDKAKESNIDMQNQLLTRLKTEVVDRLGIKKGSKESALVQQFGEGKITLDELKQQSPGKWQNVVEADKWFRTQYDTLIDQINASKREIYPNAEKNMAKIQEKMNEVRADKTLTGTERREALLGLEDDLERVMRGKFIPKRNDYYRHFHEITEGVQGLKNIFDSPANISTSLIGASEFTKPKSKWASFAQKRIGDKTTEDAVGGFLNYVPAASYATHIDPQIARFRDYTQALRDATKDTHEADTFIGFLDKFANDLAGKTNPADRFIQDFVPGGRKTFAVLNWMNNRIKANVVLGKASSALAQTANIPIGIAYAKQYAIPGLVESAKSIAKPSEAMQKSVFLKERWGGAGSKIYRQFDSKLIDKPKDMAVWLMETADKVGTTFVWNSAYTKALGEKVPDPIHAADMATRDIVAGRGIGEVPILQKSKTFQLIAPFQLEVANLWHVQKDFLNEKDFTGLIALYLLNYGYNQVMEETRGSKVVFDPIRATVDAVKEKNLTPLQRGGRIAGELVSNVPLGQTIASIYPEYGTAGLPTRKELFGSNDPTRFGSSVLIAKGIQDPLFKLALPFGGEQVKKTYQGIKDLSQGGNYDEGQLKFPVSPTLPNKIKGSLFGPSSFNEADFYYKNNLKPLSEEQTKKVDSSPDREKAYKGLMIQRRISTLDDKIKSIKKDAKLSDEEKSNQVQSLEIEKLRIVKEWRQ